MAKGEHEHTAKTRAYRARVSRNTRIGIPFLRVESGRVLNGFFFVSYFYNSDVFCWGNGFWVFGRCFWGMDGTRLGTFILCIPDVFDGDEDEVFVLILDLFGPLP